MNPKAKWYNASLIPTAVLVAAFGLTACTTATPGVEGKVVDKYIEDFTEYTLVVEDASKTKWHFTIDDDQWQTIAVGQNVNSNDLQDPEADD